jgi:hypothetical protein
MAESGYTWATWRPPVDATVVGRVLEQIETEHGACSPRLYVDYARPVDSPTHATLEWDNDRAAEEYRVVQARRVISNLRIVVEDRPQQVPAFVAVAHVPNMSGGGYVTTLRAMSDETLRAQVLRDTMRQLLGLRRRAEALSEFKAVWDAVDEVAAQVDGDSPSEE